MAEQIISAAPAADGAIAFCGVPLDAVFVRSTGTIERDYVERNVFPGVRSSSLHPQLDCSVVTPIEAQAMLEDAKVMLEDPFSPGQGARGPLRHAYRNHLRKIKDAIEEAIARRAAFQAQAAVKVEGAEDGWQRWRGTKEQLQAVGFVLEGPWPAEPGGKRRWSLAAGRGDSSVHIKRYWPRQPRNWPVLYVAEFYIPVQVQPAAPDSRVEKRKVEAMLELKDLPRNAREYLESIAADVRWYVAFKLKYETQPREFHGFTLAEGSVEDILGELDEVFDAIMKADVRFDSGRQLQRKLKLQQDVAQSDRAFQHQLSELTRPNPGLLEGRS